MWDPPPIQVIVNKGVLRTLPYSVGVYRKSGEVVTLTWLATTPGTSFPKDRYFEWKTAYGIDVPRHVTDDTLKLDYVMPSGDVRWEYTIWIKLADGTIVAQDPEVDNRPPAGSGDDGDNDDQGKKKR